jgi:hypothetical protein
MRRGRTKDIMADTESNHGSRSSSRTSLVLKRSHEDPDSL